KRIDLPAAAALVQDGQTVALGGNLLHRAPNAFARELARQGRRGLHLIKTAGAYDVDLLCAAGCVAAVSAGFVGFENEFGLAPAYRRAVEEGRVEAREHACYTAIMSLRAAAFGVPFLPVAGFQGSDLPAARGFRTVNDPYSGQPVLTVPRIEPDWAVVHVPVADAQGNARILGTEFEDVLMSRAARGVILTAERLAEPGELEAQPELTRIPGFLVTAIALVPGGARPGSCYPLYDYEPEAVREYLACWQDGESLAAYLRRTAERDRASVPALARP
ncbi:MAG TPA: CoA-transferase, partial [Dehalococcoidia bacterium]|nr:CoA-transferase [Dehalococcoidia bacterium]